MSLLLPALFPSWRFFMTVGPSPRIEFRRDGGQWRESHPKPAHLSASQMLTRLLWNHPRNTQLYLVALAERLIAAPSQHSENELKRLVAEAHGAEGAALQFRLVFVMREADEMISEVLFESTEFTAAQVLS